MRLTTYDREAFVRAVMRDLPEIDHKDVQPKIQEALLKAMSPEARRLYRKCPRALKESCSFSVSTDRYRVGYIVGDADEHAVLAPFLEATAARKAVETRLAAVIKSCSTLKQAKERLPEFEKYLPAERESTGVTSLPVISNLVADLSKLGWPKKEG